MNLPHFPGKGDYPKYFESYLALAKGQDFLGLINSQVKEMQTYFESKGEAWAEKSYAAGKWTPKQVLGHITDTERVMAYRALCIARGDEGDLPGFDQDPYVLNGGFNRLSSADLLSDFKIHRIALLSLIRTIPQEAFGIKGKANGNVITSGALIWIIPAHCAHHFKVLKQKY